MSVKLMEYITGDRLMQESSGPNPDSLWDNKLFLERNSCMDLFISLTSIDHNETAL